LRIFIRQAAPKTTTRTISPEQIIIPVLNLMGCAFPL
jgi:hypothetical protein